MAEISAITLSMKDVAIIGGGPAGLMAAEILAGAGCRVTVYEHKPSVGRKFLMAGRGGLNITHSEPLEKFLTQYGEAQKDLSPALQSFSPANLMAWSEGLNEPTFVGSSGRVFPKSLKASPLLRAWLVRLEALGVEIKRQYEWSGWNEQGALIFKTKDGREEIIAPDATLLALGGASWPSLGSDGHWTKFLADKNIPLSPFRASNCGFEVSWSPFFRNKFSGKPLKDVSLHFKDRNVHGEVLITQNGMEGGAVYALSSVLRDGIEESGKADITIDLRPQLSLETLKARLNTPRGKQSFSTYLKKVLNLPAVYAALLYEADPACQSRDAESLARLIKAVPVTLSAPFSIERAISTAGGIPFGALDNFMIKSLPGVFAAGEMLDWEAPTGGYLLQATFATAHSAAHSLLNWLKIPFDAPSH